MIVYNITTKIEPAIEAEWLRWQKEEHIPEIMSSGQFTEYKFYRLLEPKSEDDLVYIVQYFTPSLDDYNIYINEYASLIRQKAFDKWGDHFIAFRTLMQVVN